MPGKAHQRGQFLPALLFKINVHQRGILEEGADGERLDPDEAELLDEKAPLLELGDLVEACRLVGLAAARAGDQAGGKVTGPLQGAWQKPGRQLPLPFMPGRVSNH